MSPLSSPPRRRAGRQPGGGGRPAATAAADRPAADLSAGDVPVADLCAADLCAADLPAADLCAADLYGRSLVEAGAGGDADAPGWRVRAAEGWSSDLPLHQWCGGLSPADSALLDRCRGPVLDAGCGPGRLAAGLAARGIRCLGIDRSPVAVALAARRGATVRRACLFQRLPGEGSWATVLLADGNIGIGGDPGRLLRRLREVVSPTGRIVAEVGAPGSGSGPLRLRLEAPEGAPGPWFPWARLAVDDVAPLAAATGLRLTHRWASGGRRFVELAR